MAPADWCRIAALINNNNFAVTAIQSAVWVFSDNEPLASVTSANVAEADLLRNTIASIKGIEIPWYSMSFEKDSLLLISGKHEKIWGNVEYYLRNNSLITITIRNKKGKLMSTLSYKCGT